MSTATPGVSERPPVRQRSTRRAASDEAVDRDATRSAPAGPSPAGRKRPAEANADAIDQDLVRRVQGGDTVAFDLLVKKYQHRVSALLARYVADPAEREDVAQETFLRAYRGMSRFRGDSAFYTWLYRIAVNTATNHQVAAARRRASRGVDPADAEEFDDGALLQDGATPERHAARDEVTEAIDRAVASMPESLRRAITLREMDGLAYEEIARAMDCPIGTVRSRIARARAVIDAALEPVLERPDAIGAR